MSLLCAGALALAGGTAAAAALDDPAQPPPELSLAWQAPPGCPGAADVEAQFARLLGGVHRKPTTKHLMATATVQRTAGGSWIVRLETALDGVAGQRALEGDSCWTVASAAALILALTIDPNATAEPEPRWETPPPAPPPALPTAPLTATPPRAPPRPFARAFGGATLALLPAPALTGGVAAGVRAGRWRGELLALATQTRRQTTLERAEAGGNFHLLAVAARACWDVTPTRLTPRLCAGGEWEHLTGEGFGVSAPGSGSATMAAATLDAVLAFSITQRVELALDLGAAGRPYHPTFRLANVGSVFSTPAISFAAGLSVGISL